MSSVVLVDNGLIVCLRLAEEIFITHSTLTQEQVSLGVNALCSLKLSSDKLATILLLLNRSTTVGRAARLWNDKVDAALRQGDTTAVLSLFSTDISAFEEYAKNKELTSSERASLAKEIDREYNAMYMALTAGVEGDSFLPCEEEQLSMNGVSIYTKCYRNVCVAETTKEGLTPSCGLLKASSCQLSSYQVIDLPSMSKVPHVYCLEYDEILKSLILAKPLNPITDTPWSLTALNALNLRFSKDVKLYRYYLQHK